MYSSPLDLPSFIARAIRFVTDPSLRVSMLILVAYVAAALGLGVAFFGGIREPTSRYSTYGIVLLFVSFVCLFYVSVTIISLEQG